MIDFFEEYIKPKLRAGPMTRPTPISPKRDYFKEYVQPRLRTTPAVPTTPVSPEIAERLKRYEEMGIPALEPSKVRPRKPLTEKERARATVELLTGRKPTKFAQWMERKTGVLPVDILDQTIELALFPPYKMWTLLKSTVIPALTGKKIEPLRAEYRVFGDLVRTPEGKKRAAQAIKVAIVPPLAEEASKLLRGKGFDISEQALLNIGELMIDIPAIILAARTPQMVKVAVGRKMGMKVLEKVDPVLVARFGKEGAPRARGAILRTFEEAGKRAPIKAVRAARAMPRFVSRRPGLPGGRIRPRWTMGEAGMARVPAFKIGQKVVDVAGKEGIIKGASKEAGTIFYNVAFRGVKELAKLSEGLLRPIEAAKPTPVVKPIKIKFPAQTELRKQAAMLARAEMAALAKGKRGVGEADRIRRALTDIRKKILEKEVAIENKQMKVGKIELVDTPENKFWLAKQLKYKNYTIAISFRKLDEFTGHADKWHVERTIEGEKEYYAVPNELETFNEVVDYIEREIEPEVVAIPPKAPVEIKPKVPEVPPEEAPKPRVSVFDQPLTQYGYVINLIYKNKPVPKDLLPVLGDMIYEQRRQIGGSVFKPDTGDINKMLGLAEKGKLKITFDPDIFSKEALEDFYPPKEYAKVKDYRKLQAGGGVEPQDRNMRSLDKGTVVWHEKELALVEDIFDDQAAIIKTIAGLKEVPSYELTAVRDPNKLTRAEKRVVESIQTGELIEAPPVVEPKISLRKPPIVPEEVRPPEKYIPEELKGVEPSPEALARAKATEEVARDFEAETEKIISIHTKEIKDYLKGKLDPKLKEKGEFADIKHLSWLFAKPGQIKFGVDELASELRGMGYPTFTGDDVRELIHRYFVEEIEQKAAKAVSKLEKVAQIKLKKEISKSGKQRIQEELRAQRLKVISDQLIRLGEVAPHLVTPKQQAYIHVLKEQKLLSDSQYRRLLRIFTGKRTVAYRTPTGKIKRRAMTKEEAAKAIEAVKGVVRRPGRPPVIPMKKAITPPGFFERKFAKPTLIKYIFPSDRYARVLGVYDLIEPSMQAKMKLGIEKQKMFKWVNALEKEYLKLKKVSWLTIKKGMIRGKPVPQLVELYNNLDNPNFDPEYLPASERKIFWAMRNCTEKMLARVNEVRELYGLEPIVGIKGYITHIFDIVAREDIRIKYPFPEDLKHILPKIKTKHIYNPTAMRRMWREEGLLRDPFKALKAMISIDLKQIHLEGPAFMFREQIDALQKGITAEGMPIIPTETRQWAEDFINVVIKGYPTSLDKLTNATIEALRVDKILNLLLRPIGKGIGLNEMRSISYGLGRLIHDATIWGRLKLVIRNHTQKGLGLGLYGPGSFVKAFGPENPELKSLIDNSLFYQVSRRTFMEELPEGALAKLEKIGFAPYGHSHAGRIGGNVPFTMKQAYHASKELVTNPKYKNLGWTMEDVAKEMDFGANTCQYWYNLMGMPELYRSGLGKLFGRLQSWWMNYTTKYWGELFHRAFKGTTGWGKPIPPKWRIGALRHIIASLIFIEGVRRAFGLDYRRTALLGVLPGMLNPAGQLAIGLYNLLIAKTDWKKARAKKMIKQSWRAFIPGSLAWKDFARVWRGEKPFKSLFFYEEFKEELEPFMPDYYKEYIRELAPKIDYYKEYIGVR